MKKRFENKFIVALIFFLLLTACNAEENNNSDIDSPDDGDSIPDDDSPADDDDDDDNDDNNDNDDTSPQPAEWRFVTDEQGRAMVLHGCNFAGSAKGDSGLPDLTREQALNLGAEWGFNFTRYLFFWLQVEPEPGEYNEAYLDEVEARLDWMAEAGIYVVLDMHQDLWGPFITPDWGGSDGAPEWATITDDWPHIPFGDWLGNWGFNYLSPAVSRAFDNFWDYDGAHPELQDHYAAMWAHIAERFRDHPAVLGYDPMNEPWQGTDLFNYREFDETKYHAFNQRMIDAIRSVDEDTWIFYEPCAFGPNQGLPSFMPVLDDPRAGENRLAYFPHFYPLRIDLVGGYDPEVDHSMETWATHRWKEAKTQQAPLLAGEWSMLRWFDDENRHLFTDDALRMFERISSGWAYWECDWFVGDTDPEFKRLLGSVYPQRIAGKPVSYGYDEAARIFTLVFEQRTGVTGSTEIFIPQTRNYPEGWSLEVGDPQGTWTSQWDETSQVLSVWTDPNTSEHTIRILPSEQ